VTPPRLVFRPQAESELLEARGWYESQRAGLGQTFTETVDQVLASILSNPLAHPPVHGETRRAVLRRFPYAIYFHVMADEIVVLAVMHGRRRPQLWRERR
jgi:plasmid stabilization system protein ParE